MDSAAIVQRATLAECEADIERYVASYSVAGQALLDIYQRQLWKEAERYETFEAYVADRWNFTLGRASQLMSAGKFWRQLVVARAPVAPPETERHFRPLLRVKGKSEDETQDQRVECWVLVNDEAAHANSRITPDFVDTVVDKYTGYRPAPPPPPTPLRLADLELAFEHIADCGITPERARLEFGDPSGWRGFDAALDWMQRVKAL